MIGPMGALRLHIAATQELLMWLMALTISLMHGNVKNPNNRSQVRLVTFSYIRYIPPFNIFFVGDFCMQDFGSHVLACVITFDSETLSY